MWRANMRRSALNRERQTYSYTRFCSLCVRALILWSVPLPSYKVHHFSLSNWQTLFNLIIKRNFKLPIKRFWNKMHYYLVHVIHVIQVEMYQIDHVMWHWMVPESRSKEEDWVAVLWCDVFVPVWSWELSGRSWGRRPDWTCTCCWSWRGHWSQSTSCCHSLPAVGRCSSPTVQSSTHLPAIIEISHHLVDTAVLISQSNE